MKPKLYSRWDPPPKVLAPIGAGAADQSFAAEADINNVMRRYELTGSLVDPQVRATRQLAFVNCLDAPQTFQEAQNLLLEASRAFQGLPSRVRARFQGSPALLLEFMADPGNRAEAVQLGLLEPPEEPASQPPKGAE